MGSCARILVLLSNVEAGQALAAQLSAGRIAEAETASDVAEAIRLLRSQPFDMVVAGTDLQRPPAVDFLAKTREFLPCVLRVLFEETPFKGDLRRAINDASPCAILSGTSDPVRLAEAVQTQRDLFESAARGALQAYRSASEARPPSAVLVVRPRLATGARPGAVAGVRSGAPAPLLAPPAPPRLRSASAGATQGKTGSVDRPSAAPPAAPLPMLDGRTLEIADKLEVLLEQPSINLPTLPGIAMEVRKLVADENVGYEQIAQKVSLDQAMSARMLEVANSPLYATTEPVRNIQSAISRIGIRETRNILQAVVAEGMFRAADKRFSNLLNQLWMHSLAVAYGNEILARTLAIPESQDFFMMGLLHDIGKLLVLCLLGEGLTSGLIAEDEVSDDVVQAIFLARHNDLGLRLMKKWGFADAFRRVAALHNDDARVQEYEEGVIVTYYANLLSRKIGLSLRPNDEPLLNNKQIAQALNLSAQSRAETTQTMMGMVEKIKQSYLRA